MTREICLNWNNHASILNEFKSFLLTEEMVDVTLSCDGKFLKAHKVVLSACSPLFRSLLSENPCKHPIVILQDLRYNELKAVIDFMYNGEINVSEEHLAPLIKAAETLKVKVLGDVMIAADESEFHMDDELESNSSDESEPQSGSVSKIQHDNESEPQSGVVSGNETESQSGALSRIQSEDESESQSATVSRNQPDDDFESSPVDTVTHQPATLTITYSPLKSRRGRPRKRSKSNQSDGGASEPENKQAVTGTEVLSDMELCTSNLDDSTVSVKSQRTKSPRKSLKKKPVEESFETGSLEVTMPILEDQMSIDEGVSINFQY